jgi:hypothetical protein
VALALAWRWRWRGVGIGVRGRCCKIRPINGSIYCQSIYRGSIYQGVDISGVDLSSFYQSWYIGGRYIGGWFIVGRSIAVVPCTSVFSQKLPKVNTHPIGEKSPNLVTLALALLTEIEMI